LKVPATFAELEDLIRLEAQEDLHLEFKDSRALDPSKKSEIAKDVSAFANSDGGILIYGIREKGHLPEAIDQGAEDARINREWIEQVILSNISPVIDNIVIRQIPLPGNGRSAYALGIPKSYRAPHQEKSSRKYYKRHNFMAEPMEDYEISDVRSRSVTIAPLVAVDGFLRHRNLAYFSIENIGNVPAHDVMISFAPEPPWKHVTKPPLLERGMKYLAPRRRHLLYYQSLIDIFKDNSDLPSEFTATVSYLHPVTMNRISDDFVIDFRDYLHTAAVDSDIVEQGKSIEDAIKKLVSELKGVKEQLGRIADIAGPTGLDLSVRTIRNLLHVKRDDSLVEKLDPVGQEPPFFEEVLGVDSSMADVLMQYFWSEAEFSRLDEIPGMTSELKNKIETLLTWRTESEADT
jgi:schlafen family protein